MLLDAARLLTDQDIHFTIAGQASADMSEVIAHRAATLSNVHLRLGFADDPTKHKLLNAADIVALPYTEFHSQSAALNDAYAYRLPVVASDVGALGPTVRDERTGIVVPPNDAPALAQSIRELAMSSRASWESVISDAAWSRDSSVVGPQLRSIYGQVVGE